MRKSIVLKKREQLLAPSFVHHSKGNLSELPASNHVQTNGKDLIKTHAADVTSSYSNSFPEDIVVTSTPLIEKQESQDQEQSLTAGLSANVSIKNINVTTNLLASKHNLPASTVVEDKKTVPDGLYFTVLYTKRSNKKHKSFSDGVIAINGYYHIPSGQNCILKSDEDAQITKSHLGFPSANLSVGSDFILGNWEIEVVESLAPEAYQSGRIFIGRSKAAALPPTTAKRSRTNENATPSVSSAPIQILPESTSKRICVEECQMPAKTSQMMSSSPGIIALASAPAISSSVMMQLKNPGAVVINQNYRSTREFPIIIDAHIARHLRPHQIDGVNFMYNCLMGLTNPNFNGAILADEMGLGKTLQAIAIIWTMLKTGPQGHPCISKAIIICPTTLVANWQNELVKWLGTVRLAPLTLVSGSKLEEQQTTLTRFLQSNANPVLITSYEMYRKKSELICNALLASNKKMSTTQLALSGIVICDEGHRLKNSGGNQTIKALNLLPWKRRLILSGTPVQNNLTEFFSMCEFVNPTFLGSLKAFKNTFETPIGASRDSGCSDADKLIGEARSAELSRLTSSFVLRRTAELLRKYLPPKAELVVFCRFSALQLRVYKQLLSCRNVLFRKGATGKEHTQTALALITAMKKVCNFPGLVFDQCQDAYLRSQRTSSIFEADGVSCIDPHLSACFSLFPDRFNPVMVDCELSGKLEVLLELLRHFRVINDKTVVVSNFCASLDVVQRVMEAQRWGWLRLDGETPGNSRQDLVSRFNAVTNTEKLVFLLSAKAGGVGLNLIGANRLVLLDPDWNPATDAQAMARIWRDGQTKRVHIYRLLSTGSIDEKIFQRQLRKQEVADSVVDEKQDVCRKFTAEDLQALFVYRDSQCETFDLMNFSKSGSSEKLDSRDWNFFPMNANVSDPAIQAIPARLISFVFSRRDDAVTECALKFPDLQGKPHEDSNIDELELETKHVPEGLVEKNNESADSSESCVCSLSKEHFEEQENDVGSLELDFSLSNVVEKNSI